MKEPALSSPPKKTTSIPNLTEKNCAHSKFYDKQINYLHNVELRILIAFLSFYIKEQLIK